METQQQNESNERRGDGSDSTGLVMPLAYLVLDENGEPVHCASWPEACHEHINDAINEHDFTEAAKWRVVAVAEVPYVR